MAQHMHRPVHLKWVSGHMLTASLPTVVLSTSASTCRLQPSFQASVLLWCSIKAPTDTANAKIDCHPAHDQAVLALGCLPLRMYDVTIVDCAAVTF